MKPDPLDELDERQRALALRLRTLLRESETPDSATAGRLAAARARALQSKRRSLPRWAWASGGLTAAAVVAALLVQLGPASRFTGDAGRSAAADALEVLTDDNDPDFYEDLELYRWLAEDARA